MKQIRLCLVFIFTILLVLALASYCSAENGNILHLKFDESSGNIAYDSSGKDNNGVLMNGPVWTAGKFGNALSFDGVNDYVSLGTKALGYGQLAVSVWFKYTPTCSSDFGGLISKYGRYDFTLSVYCSRGDTVSFARGANSSGQIWSKTVLDGNWHHMVMTQDGIYNRLYLDGAFQNQFLLSGNINDDVAPITIGAFSTPEKYFKGLIDEVRIYNYALSPQQVMDLYNNIQLTPSDITPPVLSSGYPSGTLAAGTTSTTLSLTTDENATCKYSTTAGVSYSSMSSTFSSIGGLSHSAVVSGLQDGQSYNYYVRCQDPAGNANPNDYLINFSVENGVILDITPPVRSNGYPNGSLADGTTSTTLSLTTDENANCRYSNNTNTGYSSMTNTFTTTGAAFHSTTISGLQNGGVYNYYIRCQDTAGNMDPDDFMISFSVANSPLTPDITTGLIGFWRFDESSGTTLSDSSGKGNNGVLMNGPVWVSGKTGNALSFDGVNDYVSLGTKKLGYTTFTVSAWFKYTPLCSGSYGGIISKDGRSDFALTVYCSRGDTVSFVQNEAGNASGQIWAKTVLDGNWHHMVMTQDGVYNRLYLDGAFQNQFALPGNVDDDLAPITIGSYSSLNNYFNGSIDEVRIYNRALDSTEIQFLYNPSQGDKDPPIRFSGLPLGTLPAETTQTTISLSTNENATCRYATRFGTAFSSMPYTFTTPDGLAHSAVVSGLQSGSTYYYYVRCQDSSLNTNTYDFYIYFSLARDTIPPIRSFGTPSGNLSAGTRQTTISLTTNENASCRFSTTPNIPYLSMQQQFSTFDNKNHSTTVTGLQDGQTYRYYIKCLDKYNNSNTDDYLISFFIEMDTTPPVISSGSPSGNLSAGTNQSVISLTTNEIATCRFSKTAGTPYSSMVDAFSTADGKNHSALVTGLKNGQTYNFYVRCNDNSGNMNSDDYIITFSINSPLFILSMNVSTLKDVYYTGEQINLTDPPQENPSTNVHASIATSSVSNDDAELQEKNSYIIEFMESPVVGKRLEEEEKIVELQKLSQEYKKNAAKAALTLRLPNLFMASQVDRKISSLSNSLPNTLREQKKKINKERLSAISDINSRLATSEKLKVDAQYSNVFNGITANITEEEAEKIKESPYVKNVYPDLIVNITLMDSVPIVNGDDVWNMQDSSGGNITGEGITIAIIDTGIDYTHPDLSGCLGASCKVIEGYDFINNDNNPMDDNGHGTHVAGIASGNGTLRGVAPDSKLYAYKVLNSGGVGYESLVIAGIERSVDPNSDGNFSDHADIISMSLGVSSGNPDDLLSRTVDNAVAVGAVVVVSAGNSGPGGETIASPGTARNAITVGATYKKNYSGSYWDYNPIVNQIAAFSSRGPVIWGNGSIIKPDIVAPGAIICSARYDTVYPAGQHPYYMPCIDDNHVQIAGTSMSAPHVAGAAALLKQAHPDWTPEQIKMAIRSTAKKLGNIISKEGYGMLDISEAVQVNDPCIAEISTNGEVKGVINIKGTAKCDSFNNYSVYYKTTGDFYDNLAGSWIKVYESSNQVINDSIYTFNTVAMDDLSYFVKIVVTNGFNESYEDIAIIKINNFGISRIGELNYIKEGSKIYGKIYIPWYTSYKVEYKKTSETNWSVLCDGNTLVDDVLCQIDVNKLDNGLLYDLRLSVLVDSNWIKDIPVRTAVVKEMLEGWPAEIQGFPKRGGIEEDVDNDGSNEVVIPHYSGCSGMVCGAPALYIFEKNGSYVRLDNLKKNGAPYSMIGGGYISYHRDESGKNMVGMAGYDVGLFDYQGEYYPGWPYTIMGDAASLPFTVVSDSSQKLFFTGYDSGNKNISRVIGLSSDGSLLPGFPITITAESLSDVSINSINTLRTPDGFFVSVLAEEYDNQAHKYSEFVNIYTLQGDLVKRTYLNNLSQNITKPVMASAAGDINNDGNTEVVVGVGLMDYDMPLADIYNPEAYKSYVYVINTSGDIISIPFSLNGYLVKDVVIGTFQGRKAIVASLSSTFPTSNFGEKIVVFDINGTVLFSISISDINDRIQGLAIVDTDDDGESEIIANCNPKFWEGMPSKLLIFGQSGMLEREIKIPTMGEVDHYFGISPIASDLNGDSKLDLVLESYFIPENKIGVEVKTRVYVIDLNSTYKEDMDWPMDSHDSQRTDCYDCQNTSLPSLPLVKSMINNTGLEDATGILMMSAQKMQEGNWSDYMTVVNQQASVPANGYLALDEIWNPFNVRINETGNYRVHASFEAAGETEEAVHEFAVT